MKLGANSVLFGAFDMETAFKYTAMAGYDGIELSAIPGMSEHLVIAVGRNSSRKSNVFHKLMVWNFWRWNNLPRILPLWNGLFRLL